MCLLHAERMQGVRTRLATAITARGSRSILRAAFVWGFPPVVTWFGFRFRRWSGNALASPHSLSRRSSYVVPITSLMAARSGARRFQHFRKYRLT